MKIYKEEAENLIKIIECGGIHKCISINDISNPDDYRGPYNEFDTYWVDEVSGRFTPETKEKCLNALLAVTGKIEILLLPAGTHCGGLSFIFGWVHSETIKKSALDEAVIPHANYQ